MQHHTEDLREPPVKVGSDMDPSYAELFRTPVRFRLVEKRAPRLEKFIASLGLPKFVSVECKPLPWCEPKRCFVNVERQVQRSGGAMVVGYIFGEYENRSYEGEAHAVWRPNFGRCIDITPHHFQPERVLFTEDPGVALRRGKTAAPKLVFSEDPRVRAIEEFDSRVDRIWEQAFRGIGMEMVVPSEPIRQAALDVGLPESVAKYLTEVRVATAEHYARKYAHEAKEPIRASGSVQCFPRS